MEPIIESTIDEENKSREELLDKCLEKVKTLSPYHLKELGAWFDLISNRSVSVREAAKILNLHMNTIYRAINAGKLKAFRLTSTGWWKISIDEIDKIING